MHAGQEKRLLEAGGTNVKESKTWDNISSARSTDVHASCMPCPQTTAGVNYRCLDDVRAVRSLYHTDAAQGSLWIKFKAVEYTSHNRITRD